MKFSEDIHGSIKKRPLRPPKEIRLVLTISLANRFTSVWVSGLDTTGWTTDKEMSASSIRRRRFSRMGRLS